ncbi:MAG: sel1 repeat family protein, partial [Gammaproteobacteria bacterium]|nr:sel1 repeat family protein [Gammaproteobacteria bacterium]
MNADFDAGRSAYDRGDYSTAIKEFAKSADQGDTKSQYYIGTLYYLGEGVSQDYEQAAKWYRIAADHGHAEAQLQLGTMYGLGLGLPKDDSAAVKWYKVAAEQGLADAQNSLGVRYERGQGVTQDYLQAYAWFSLAADQAHEIAAENKNLVENQMTADQKSKANLLIQNLEIQLTPTMTAKLQDGEKSDDSAPPEPNNSSDEAETVPQMDSTSGPAPGEGVASATNLSAISEAR